MEDLLYVASQGLFQPQVANACGKIDLKLDLKVQNYLIESFNSCINNKRLLSLDFGVDFLECIYAKNKDGLIDLANLGVIVAGCFPHRLDLGYIIDLSALAYEYAIRIMLENQEDIPIKLNYYVIDMVDVLLVINENSKLTHQEINALLERDSRYAKKLILSSK